MYITILIPWQSRSNAKTNFLYPRRDKKTKKTPSYLNKTNVSKNNNNYKILIEMKLIILSLTSTIHPCNPLSFG